MKINVPGKVFIMGEYTVIDGSTEAIIAPTQRHLTLFLSPSKTYQFKTTLEPYFESDDFESFILNHPSKIFKEVYETLKEKYVNVLFPPHAWVIESTLDDDKKAYGLGSSGAFRVAIIKGFLALLKEFASDDLIFEIAIKSHANEESSFGDLAVSTYQIPMIYKKPLSRAYPKIMPLNLPEYVIIHSGVKVSSAPFVSSYLTHKNDDFMHEYRVKIQALIDVFTQSGEATKRFIIKDAQTAYENMVQKLNPNILTLELKTIIKMIHAFKGIAKISGAGGGDNVLGFFKNENDKKAFITHASQTYTVL